MKKIKFLFIMAVLTAGLLLSPGVSFAAGTNVSPAVTNAAGDAGTKAGWLTTDVIIEGSVGAALLIGGIVLALTTRSSSTSSPVTTPSHH